MVITTAEVTSKHVTGILGVITQPQNIVDDVVMHEKSEDLTTRDAQFYIADADCVIRVENTLFRVSDATFCSILLLRPLQLAFGTFYCLTWTFTSMWLWVYVVCT